MIQVYRRIDGLETVTISIPNKNAVFKTGIMGAYEVQVSIITDTILDIQVGDYIKQEGIVYTLNRDAEFEIKSDVRYDYTLVFEHPYYVLLDKLYCNRITGFTSFTLTGKLRDFIELLVWCINRETNPDGVDYGWTVGGIVETEFKTITFSDLNCKEVLDVLADEFQVEYFINNKIINYVETIEWMTGFVFEQGAGFGLYRLTQQNVDKEDTITRIYVRGGNQNVPNAYADEEGYLKLPENYLENLTEHGKVVEKKVRFEDEFPHFVGTVATVSGENNKIITCPQIDFDISAIAVGDNARVNFLSGDLLGKSFQFAWQNSNKQITLVNQEDELSLPDDEGVKPTIPNASKKAKVGDTFNFTGVIMPDSYVTASINRLREKGTKSLAFHSRKRVKFSLDIDHRWMRNKPELKVGDLVVISIPQKGFYQAIRVTEIEKNLHTGAISATISNYLEESWEKYVEKRIELAKNQILSSQDNITIIDNIIYRDRGIWSADTAEIKPYLNTSKIVDDVWNLGCKWRCMNDRTLAEPRWTSEDWKMIEGRSDARMEFDSSNGYAFFAGQVSTTITPIVLIGNANVSSDIVEEQWRWTRESGDPVSDAIWSISHTGMRLLALSNEDMGTKWSTSNPVRFVCTAIYPASSINEISNYIEV